MTDITAMPRDHRTKYGNGSRLFLTYAVISLVAVAGLGAVLMAGNRQEAIDDGFRHGRAQAAVIGEMAVTPALREADLSAPLPQAQLQRLQAATELAVYNGSVVQLRVYGLTGRVVFSDDGSGLGGLAPDQAAFRRAAEGTSDAAIVRDPHGGQSQVIRVFQPIVAHASGRSTGVLEVHLPYRAIAESVQAETRRTYVRLAVGLGGLYLVLALIAWSTTRALRRHAARHEYEALHDPLTGLANRALFRVRAAEAVECGRRGEQGAIVLIDLDGFKPVNDTFGHHAGDELLRMVANRLAETLRTDDTIARLGGDEFGLVLPRITDVGVVRELLTTVRERIRAEFMVGSVALSIDSSFGVALYPAHGEDVALLVQHADAAMYHAKRGRSGIAVYDADGDDAPAGNRLVLQSEIRNALERDELVLHYQPKIELSTGQVRSVEALVRWVHPTRGLVAPGQFLPAVEQSGLMGAFTEWVLRRALHDQSAWLSLGVDWPVAVNVSARNLDADFPGIIAAMLAELGVAPDRLHLEITETAIAANAEAARQTVVALAEQGIAVAIDDFGAGYTSLSHLRALPIAEVKIDRLFVSGLGEGTQDRAIVRSVIELAHGIGAQVTAEGVETAAERQWLVGAGCDLAQGFLFARPVPWTQVVGQYASTTDAFHSVEGTQS